MELTEKDLRQTKEKSPVLPGLFSRCAGAIRSMYHEVFSGIRVNLAA